MPTNKPRWVTQAVRAAVWLACWGFLVPASVLALSLAYDEAVPVSHGPFAPAVFSLFALPVLALVGLVAELWTWRSRSGLVRALLLVVTANVYWHLFGRGMVKYLTGGMG